jgi:Quinohemoprotein amine dehydrogenase, alpha subunit domain III
LPRQERGATLNNNNNNVSPRLFFALILTFAISVQAAEKVTEGETKTIKSPTSTKKDDLVEIYSSVLNPKDAADIFGKRIGQRFLAIQVTITNRSKDLHFLLHDITFNQTKVSKSIAGLNKEILNDLSSKLNSISGIKMNNRRRNKEILQLASTIRSMMNSLSMTAVSVTGGAGNPSRMSSYDLEYLRGITEKGSIKDPRNILVSMLGGPGKISGLTVNQLNLLNDTAYEANSLIQRQQAKVMVVFIPQSYIFTKNQIKWYWRDPKVFENHVNMVLAEIKVEGTFVEELEGQRPQIDGVTIDYNQVKKFQEDKPKVLGLITGKFLSSANIELVDDIPNDLSVEIQETPTYNNLKFLLSSNQPIKPGTVIHFSVSNKEGNNKYLYIVNYDPAKPTVTAITPGKGKQGAADYEVRIIGTGFIPGLTTVNIGNNVTVNIIQMSGTEIRAILRINSGAIPGEQAVVVSNGTVFNASKTFKIIPAQ